MKSTNTDTNKTEPKFEEIEQIQKNLKDLKSDLEKEKLEDQKGELSSKVKELEGLYDDIKTRVKTTTDNSDKALRDLKLGFVNAWDQIKIAAKRAADETKPAGDRKS